MHVCYTDHVRHRRDLPANGTCQDVTKKRCPLLLVADHRLHKALGHDRVMTTVHHLVSQSELPVNLSSGPQFMAPSLHSYSLRW